jgi:hypothetical protein
MTKYVDTAMRKAIREQIERTMRPIWDKAAKDAINAPPLSEHEKSRQIELDLLMTKGYGCSGDQVANLVNFLLREMKSSLYAPPRGDSGAPFFNPGEWVVPTANPNSHDYPVDKPTVCLHDTTGVDKDFLKHQHGHGRVKPFGEGNRLPSSRENVRYAKEGELKKFITNLRGGALRFFFVAMDVNGLL